MLSKNSLMLGVLFILSLGGIITILYFTYANGKKKCIPKCPQNTCGNQDECGGTCTCKDKEQKCINGTCCTPKKCESNSCGDDGCSGTCGTCKDPTQTCFNGSCCSPKCDDKNCDDDGCGRPCGCPINTTCVNKKCTAYTTISYVDSVSGISYYLASTSTGQVVTTTSLSKQGFWQILPRGVSGFYFIKNLSYNSSYLYSADGLSLSLNSLEPTVSDGAKGIWKLTKDETNSNMLIKNVESSGYIYINFSGETSTVLLNPSIPDPHPYAYWTLSNF